MLLQANLLANLQIGRQLDQVDSLLINPLDILVANLAAIRLGTQLVNRPGNRLASRAKIQPVNRPDNRPISLAVAHQDNRLRTQVTNQLVLRVDSLLVNHLMRLQSSQVDSHLEIPV